MSSSEEWAQVEEIKRLKARYFRCMDTKDWKGFGAVFAPDATLDTTQEQPGLEVVVGNDAIAAFVESAVGNVVTVHHGHMPEIELTSPTTAKGIWSMEDMLVFPEGAPVHKLHGFGHYHETYEKIDGNWRIKTLLLTRLRRDVEMPD